MRFVLFLLLALSVSASILSAKTLVFWQDDFPTVDSAPVNKAALEKAFAGMQPVFGDTNALENNATFNGVDLLVLPYGSAFPQGAWSSILGYLRSGGNLLVIGGRPFRVPVTGHDGQFTQATPQDAYSREIGVVHTYQVPQKDETQFTWCQGYDFLPKLRLHAARYFVLQGQVDGLGYMTNTAGAKVAAPVDVSDRMGGRMVMLDFEPQANYWDSQDGTTLLSAAANYAARGATMFSLEMQYSALKPGEVPEVIVHLRKAKIQPAEATRSDRVTLQLLSGERIIATKQMVCSDTTTNAGVDFIQPLQPGFYTVRGTYEDSGKKREAFTNGFWVEDGKLLNSGPMLGVNGDFLTKDGKPFFPFGTNYFSTEDRGWLFSDARNAANWEQDFSEMEKNGVTFVRTGVWNHQLRAVDNVTGGVSERFLRNLEAYLLCARQHHIAVNFTLFAFDPQTTLRHPATTPLMSLPGGNPYLDPQTIHAEQTYMLSILDRFKSVPYLSWDLINEPSFSNPRRLWKGNTPNEDPAELASWHKWLQTRYRTLDRLAAAWSTTPDRLGSFDAVPLPTEDQLTYRLEAAAQQANAFDYNLFAQDMFSSWVHTMVESFHSAGSHQLIDVGQDEGGVESRVLNQFYGGAGVSFTTNHTYRANDALLWDSMAAKRPGVPNIVGETGFQPVPIPSGEWRYDEISAFNLLERKWVNGFADGTSGALSWDWAREIYFGLKRSDGSNKTWIDMTRKMGDFAKQAAPYATALLKPQVAIVLPQSLQLSVYNHVALEAEQNSVRALYGYARSEAYMVGEDQIELLGSPKLIILPSPWLLEQKAWEAIEKKVEAGAVLLVSGRFDEDPHFLTTKRQDAVGLPYRPGSLMIREHKIQWPGGEALLTYSGEKTGLLERAFLPDNRTFEEKPVGAGKILFFPLPLELNDNLKAVGNVYRYALGIAGVKPTYSTTIQDDPGVIICPTHFPHATLYVVTSETEEPQISFADAASGKQFSGRLPPGRAALLLVDGGGNLIASYNWNSAAQ